MVRRVRGLIVVGALALAFASAAAADWGGSDPTSNVRLGKLPAACLTAPKGKVCVNAGIAVLNKARAKLGLPAYKLPADFTSLSPDKQVFILTDLDRVQYGMPPVPGLTAALNTDAYVRGVRRGTDPSPSSTAHLTAWRSNWAGRYHNIVEAYEAWMYNDGVGSGNIDCTQTNQSGCWGHRHNVLWKFGSSAVLGMGAAGGKTVGGMRSFAMLIVGGTAAYTPTYVYTWIEAQADGAGTHVYDPSLALTH